jgi:2TM domain-containing protein
VTPETLEKAAAEVLAGRHDDQALRALRARQWRGFLAHLVPFVCVGLLLGFINVLTGGFPWAVIPMLAWGIGLASHLLAVVLPDEEKLRRRVAWQRGRGIASAASASGNARTDGREPNAGRLRVDTAHEGGAGDDYESEGEVEQALEKASRHG